MIKQALFRCFSLFFLVSIPWCLAAQSPITVTVNLLPPYPNFVDEVIEMGDQTIITLQNNDPFQSHALRLTAELNGQNGITIRTKETALPNSPIELAPGETVVMTGGELSAFYNNYSENDFHFYGISQQDIINNQSLPDGVYTICLRAYGYQSGIPLSDPSPLGCSSPFTVLAIDPPVITYPQDGTELMTMEPQLLSINWIPVSASLSDLRYRLEMVDLTDLPINPYDAFDTDDFLFYYEDNVMANVFLYGMEHPLLVPGHEYAVRVKAYGLDGPLNIHNDGYSDIVTFTYGSEDEDTTVDLGDEGESGGADIDDRDFECGADCHFALTGSQSPTDSLPQVGEILDIGNFRMRITSIEGTGPFSGQGVIQPTEHLPVGIKVEFENLQINDDRRVYAGKATAVLREGSWIDETWADIQTAVEDVNADAQTMVQAAYLLADPSNYVSNMAGMYGQVGTTLPFSIGSETNGIQVVGMHFTPERASYNLSSIVELYDDPTGTRYLHFMSKDLCLTPGGIALEADEARLELVKPVRYTFDNSTQLVFNPATSQSGEGTYMAFDCDGINGVYAEGNAFFSTDVLRPVDDQGHVVPGDSVTAHFSTTFTSWSDWVATIDFQVGGALQGGSNLFMYKELEDYLISVEQAYIDHSTEENPVGISFPDNYAANTGPDWQGVYLKSIKIAMPEWIRAFDDTQERVRLTGSDLIIDSQGLTGIITADNVLSQEDGAMGKWPITVDHVRLKIVQNSLDQAYFNGGLKIPVFEEAFDYTADMQFLGQTKHTFSFSPLEEYTIPMWYANSTINNNSSLSVTVNDGSAYVEANLNGMISFDPIIGDIDKMSLSNITFQDFVIRSKKEPTYIEIGHIGTDFSAQKLAMAGFDVILENMEWQEESADLSNLILDLDLNLSGDSYGIGGGTGLSIQNSIDDMLDSLSFEFEGIDINDIHLEAQTGVVNMEGSIGFFKNDPKFGNGFSGSLGVHFIETISLEGSVLFGNVRQGGSDFNYWYAHAMAYMPQVPVPMATPLDVYGFGGGVYMNMAMNPDIPNPREVHGSTDPREVFSVQEGILGLQASVILGLTPSSRTFNAEVGLTAEINLHTGGLNMISFDGGGYLMQPIDETPKDQSMLQAQVHIGYDFPNKTFSSTFGVQGRIPYSSPMLTVGGDIQMYRSPSLWYLKAGMPQDPMGATIDLGITGVSANGYFMTGQELDPPILPPEVDFEVADYLVNNIANGMGVGVMAGLHLGLNIELTLVGTGVIIKAGAGADIALMNYYAATCNGNEDFGVNKWYAQGQAYLYGQVTLDIFWFDVASVELNIVVDAAFPNPTGVKGRVKVSGTFLMWERSFDESFQLGSFCNIQPLDHTDDVIDRPEVELDNLALLGAVTPANGKSNLSTNTKPTIEWHNKDRRVFHFTYGDGMGGLIHTAYRVRNKYTWQKKSKNSDMWYRVINRATVDPDSHLMTLQASSTEGDPMLLEGGTTYRIEATASIEKYLSKYGNIASGDEPDHMWGTARYMEGPNEGEPIVAQKTHEFHTGTNLTEIEEMFVDYTLPYPRQRFYPYKYLESGKIKFNVSHEPKFQEFNDCGFEIYAEFTPVDGSPPPARQKVTRPNLLEAVFTMSELNPETIYKLQIIAERRITSLDAANLPEKCALPSYDEEESNTGSTEMTAFLENNGIAVNLTNFTTPTFFGSSATDGTIATLSANTNATLDLGPAVMDYGGLITLSNDTVTHRKTLYTIYFRTSMYGWPDDKINDMAITSLKFQPQVYTATQFPSPVVEDVVMTVNGGEGFDKYDLFGHDYRTPETYEYFKILGNQCGGFQGHYPFSSDRENWYFEHCALLLPNIPDPFNPGDKGSNWEWNESLRQAYQFLPDFAELEYQPDPSNDAGVKHLEPLLSDSEVGLVSNDPINYIIDGSSTFILGAGTAMTASPPVWMSSGIDLGNMATRIVPLDNSYTGEPKLELRFNIARKAAIVRDYLLELRDDLNFDHVEFMPFRSPPADTYPIKIWLINHSELAKEHPNPTRSRMLNVTIPYNQNLND